MKEAKPTVLSRHVTNAHELKRRFARCLNRMMATTIGGEKVDLWFRETLGFRKIDGRWTITHEHSSVAFYMDGS
jgi:ketosteroid isomerase-like protein